jgi:hypothetical protein
VYNGFHIEDLGQFRNHLEATYDDFNSELNDNLLHRNEGLKLYLANLLVTISKIHHKILDYQHENVFEVFELNEKIFLQNRLHELNQFIGYQLEIAAQTKVLVEEKLNLVSNSDIFNQASQDEGDQLSPILKNKIRCNLPKIDLTVLLWLLVEANIIAVGKKHHNFISFIEDNFQYFDTTKQTYCDLKQVKNLMAKLNGKTKGANVIRTRVELLNLLQETTLPPKNSLLEKQTYCYS